MINTLQKGVGDYQIAATSLAKATIIKVLADGEWHQYSELKQKTGVSSATLCKHLKQLKGIVRKKVDIESGKYPYPVYYMLPIADGKEFAEVLAMYNQWRKKLGELMLGLGKT